jgi:hypothetical protein
MVTMASNEGPSGHPCTDGCLLGESGISHPDGLLTVALAGGGDRVQLSGTVQAERNGRIGQVISLQRVRRSSGLEEDLVFSSKIFFPQLEVLDGQTIAVSVVFSFS